MTIKRNGWFVPPIKGLLEPESNPTSKVDHIPQLGKQWDCLMDYDPATRSKRNLNEKSKRNKALITNGEPEHELYRRRYWRLLNQGDSDVEVPAFKTAGSSGSYQ